MASQEASELAFVSFAVLYILEPETLRTKFLEEDLRWDKLPSSVLFTQRGASLGSFEESSSRRVPVFDKHAPHEGRWNDLGKDFFSFGVEKVMFVFLRTRKKT